MVAKHVHSSQIIADPHNILTFSFCFMSAISAREGIQFQLVQVSEENGEAPF